MASQRFTIPFRGFGTLGQSAELSLAVDAALAASGEAGTTLARLVWLNSALQLSVTGGDLSDAWESGGSTTFEYGSSRLVVGQANPPDRDQPYTWPAGTAGVDGFFSALAGNVDLVMILDDGVAPPAATTVTAEAGGPYTVAPGATVRLDGSAAVENGSGVTAYAWEIISGGGSLQNPNTARPTYTPPVLAAGGSDRDVVLRMTATNAGVSDSDDAALTATAPPAVVVQPSVVSGPVRNLAAAVEDGEANPTWGLPNTGDAPTAILVDYRIGNGSWGITQELAGDATTTRIAPLDNGVTITIRVRTRNDAGTSTEARVDVTPAAPTAVSGPVRNLAAAVEDGEANPAWDLPSSGDAPTAILVDFRIGNGPWGITQELAGDATTTRIAPLDNGVTITIRVRTRNDAGTSTEARVSVTPAEAEPLPSSPPTGVVQTSRMDAGPVVDLFEVELQGGAVERYTTGPRDGASSVVYGGREYRPLPIALERAGFGGSGAAARPTLRVSRLDGTAVPQDWQGATVKRTRTLARYLDGAAEADPSRHWPVESWVVDRQADRGRDEVVWQLSSPLDLELARIPRRQVLRDVCPWPYRRRVGGVWENPEADDGCPYRGNQYWNAQDEAVANPALDVCSRRLSGCKLRFGENGVLPFGGFAGVRR